jgi:hypothetical protein
MPIELRHAAAERLIKYNGPTKEQDKNLWYKDGIKQVISYLLVDQEPDLNEWNKFFEYNDFMAKYRKLDWIKIFPEFVSYDPRKNKKD